MTVTALPYNQATLHLGMAEVNLVSATIKAMLVTSGYAPDVDNHVFVSDITNETVGTGYTAGGETLIGQAWTYDPTGHQAVLTADTTVWSAATFVARYAVVYVDTGTPSTSVLLSYADFGADAPPVGVDFTLAWADLASGGVYSIAPVV